ncbi:hypothetical protein FA15DRAFT_656628 [Coprinopsis marcescibilis]|uniref:CFEM domain-containing protein n=1 Tax=Coprinopsis marcescibilis TaxID=230819 RepID=A0A5C3KSM7_COPMA|nr:hypothetical protein FA15DRAFT_656628 [Coprinopsis marcescibilis]
MLVVTLLLAFAAIGLAAPAPQLGVDDVSNGCAESCAIAEIRSMNCEVEDLGCWCPSARYVPATAGCIRRTCSPESLEFLGELAEQCSRPAVTSESQDSPVATNDVQDSPAATGVDTGDNSPQATGQPPNPTSANVGAENGAVRMKGAGVKTVGLFLAAGIAALVF